MKAATSWRAALLVLILLAALALPAFANRGIVFLAAVTYLYIVFAFSWNLMFRYTGMASFGHGAFFAIGAYCYAGIAYLYPGIPFLLSILASGLFGFVVALLLGLVVVRRSHGVYFAVLTIALGQVVYLIVTESAALGRDDGFTGIVRPVIDLGLARIDLNAGNNYYYFVVIAAVVLSAVMWWIVNSRLGRAFRAVQQDPERAAFFGIDVFRHRLLSFSIAAGIAAIAGGIYAPLLQIVTPGLSYFVFSAQPVLYTMLGGMNSFWGPALGGLIFAALEYGTRALVGVSELVTGFTLLFVVLALPAGLLGLAATLRTVIARGRRAPAIEVGGRP